MSTSSIAFIGQCSQSDPLALSGTNQTIFRALSEVTSVADLSGYRQVPSFPYRLMSKASQVLPWAPNALPYHCWKNVRSLAYQVSQRAKDYNISAIICPSSIAVAACKYPNPHALTNRVMLYTDATVKSLVGYYPEWKSVYRKSFLSACEIEAFALSAANKIVVSSDWAARSVIEDYGISPNNVNVMPRSANLPSDPGPIDTETLKCRKRNITLVTIASNWQRKGLPVAVAATGILRAMGIPARLLVIGLDPSIYMRNVPDYLLAYPKIKKYEASGKDLFYSLLRYASIFIFPTRAEAMGISLTEACAFSLPIVASDTGGVSTVVKPGINGYLLSINSAANEYADTIALLLSNDSVYASMCSNAYALYKSSFQASDLGSRLLYHIDRML